MNIIITVRCRHKRHSDDEHFVFEATGSAEFIDMLLAFVRHVETCACGEPLDWPAPDAPPEEE